MLTIVQYAILREIEAMPNRNAYAVMHTLALTPFSVPRATVYRKMLELTDIGLIEVSGVESSRNGMPSRRYALTSAGARVLSGFRQYFGVTP